MIDKHDAARILDDVLLAAETEVHPDDLRYPHHASGRHSGKERILQVTLTINLYLSGMLHILTMRSSSCGFGTA